MGPTLVLRSPAWGVGRAGPNQGLACQWPDAHRQDWRTSTRRALSAEEALWLTTFILEPKATNETPRRHSSGTSSTQSNVPTEPASAMVWKPSDFVKSTLSAFCILRSPRNPEPRTTQMFGQTDQKGAPAEADAPTRVGESEPQPGCAPVDAIRVTRSAALPKISGSV